MRVSKVEHHLLHPEPQLYHRVGILKGTAENSILKMLEHSGFIPTPYFY
jgi:hypothetical protein